MPSGFSSVGEIWFPPALGFSIDGSASVLFAAMATAPSNARKALYSTFITSLKAAGVWSKLDVIHLYAAHDSAVALINVKSPGTYDGTLVNSPTFGADLGFTFNGTDNHIDTGFNPSSAGGNYTQDSAMLAVRSRTAGQVANAGAGWFDGTDGISLGHRNTSNQIAFRINQAAGSLVASITDGAAFVALNRSASDATQCYRNGSAQTVGTNPNQTSTALNDHVIDIGRITAALYAAREIASVYIGGSLSATEHAALRAADLAYMQAVGAV